MMSCPLVSVVIPVYNTSAYLHRCMESVIGQTYKNIEIVVVNDGSTDNSLEIMKEYSKRDQRIVCIDKKNEGLPLARKTGVANVTGDYIQFLDSDDALASETVIENLVKTAVEHDADIVTAPYILCDSDGTEGMPFMFDFKEIPGVDYLKKILGNWEGSWCVPANFQKRTLYSKHNIVFIPDISLGEDALLMGQLFLVAKKIVAVNVPTFRYYRHADAMSYNKKHYMSDEAYRQLRTFPLVLEKIVADKGLSLDFEFYFAAFRMRNVWEAIARRRFRHVHSEMVKIKADMQRFPELAGSSFYHKRFRKVFEFYSICPLLGWVRIYSYIRRGIV